MKPYTLLTHRKKVEMSWKIIEECITQAQGHSVLPPSLLESNYMTECFSCAFFVSDESVRVHPSGDPLLFEAFICVNDRHKTCINIKLSDETQLALLLN
jgi:hypothetical protein